VGTSPNGSRNGRKFDVLVWGATGFTGHLVAEFLTRTYGVDRGLSWALGGRNRAKLEEVRARLAVIDPAASTLPLVVGDSGDRSSLDRIVRETRVVITTVGPYALHGAQLVAACVEAATDYVDLAGEPPFIRDMIDRHHARARETGARIVHSCGYDSIPSDLGTLVAQETMRSRRGVPCAEVKCFAGETRGGLSGGTLSSMLNMVEAASHDARVRRVLANPYSLDPDRGERGPDKADQMGVRWDADLGRWTGPFVMAAINTRIVRRSNALLGYAYGRDFRYREAQSTREGAKGLLGAAAWSVGTVGVFGAMTIGSVRKLVAKSALVQSGTGPSPEAREAGFFVTRLVGTAAGDAPAKVFVTVKGKGDPGYSATARMLSESAVCLVRDREAIAPGGGVLTPASCMGMKLVERLGHVAISFVAAPDRAVS
jgi:short subunit dehydrogenase-like uncharacterized protein